jgi:hypothetical protein
MVLLISKPVYGYDIYDAPKHAFSNYGFRRTASLSDLQKSQFNIMEQIRSKIPLGKENEIPFQGLSMMVVKKQLPFLCQ